MTIPPQLSPDEPTRLRALRSLNLVDTPIEERFERITRLARRLLNVEIAAISLIEADRQWFKTIQGLNAEQTSRDISFCGHAILRDDVMCVPNARKDPRFAKNPLVMGLPSIAMYAGCPIRAEDGSKIGTLCVIDPKPRELDSEDMQALRDLAALAEAEIRSSVAAAVQASLIEDYSAEQRRAVIDPLTRIWNRQGILQVAADALGQVVRNESSAAILLIDLDRLKHINDTHGHGAGDEALRECAKRSLAALGEIDAIGRIGGDEFLAVLAPCESLEIARLIADRVRARIGDEPVRTSTAEFDLTASIGVRFLEAGVPCELESQIHRADQALYQSKAEGRDRVVIADADSAPPSARSAA